MANLINFGIIPLTFKNPEDYDKINEGDDIEITRFNDSIGTKDEILLLDKTTNEKIVLNLNATERQREILLSGGLLNYTKNKETK